MEQKTILSLLYTSTYSYNKYKDQIYKPVLGKHIFDCIYKYLILNRINISLQRNYRLVLHCGWYRQH
ncbi:unnamed protein product [Adineta ricciae]|uniref:Uncharacterized protein n=1 Tax=Adineta ricciae TaxID=249248 RepID=A0A815K561_ADIRI|nr:unnamed protein product [Adineta ricciae]